MKEDLQRRPYTRLTEAMAEVAVELIQARALVLVLERQYQMLELEHARTQTFDASPQVPYEFLEQ